MELSPSSKYLARRDEPIDDAERESLTKRLASEFEAGRLEQDEYMRLLDELYDAKNLGELAPIVKRVPVVVAETPPIVGTGSGTPGELAPITARSLQPVLLAGAALGAVLVLLVIFFLVL